MTNAPKTPPKSGTTSREDRLKAALKANMGKRKAQARARAEAETAPQDTKDQSSG